MEGFDKQMKDHLAVLDNPYVSSATTLFLILYASMAAPQLPQDVAKWFDNTWFQLVVFFLIAYTAQRKPVVAALVAAGMMVSIQTLKKHEMNQKLVEVVRGVSQPSASTASPAASVTVISPATSVSPVSGNAVTEAAQITAVVPASEVGSVSPPTTVSTAVSPVSASVEASVAASFASTSAVVADNDEMSVASEGSVVEGFSDTASCQSTHFQTADSNLGVYSQKASGDEGVKAYDTQNGGYASIA